MLPWETVRIYLDHNATSPPAPGVVDAVARAMATCTGNASSIHHFGQQAKAALDDARSAVAALIDAEPGDVVFTSGGTEAINAALCGAADALEAAGRRHVVVSGIEHEAVLRTVPGLVRRGWTSTAVAPTPEGLVEPQALLAAMTPETSLVAVMHANNEVGTVQPIRELAAAAHANGALVLVDAVQSVGKIPVSVRALGADLLALSGHKFGGPKGTGALWVRRGVKLTPWITGGRQERNRRAGTENGPAIAGLGVAATQARDALATNAWAPIAALRDRLEEGLLASVPGCRINGARDARVPNTANLSLDGVEAESLLIALDLEGVAVSTGSACSSGTLEPSHVLRAMGFPAARVRSAIRFSLGPTTTAEDVERVLELMPTLVAKLRRLGRTMAAVR